MRTTTIRVDTATHARLVELSRDRGTSLVETVREATDALQRRRFAHHVAEELADLRQDPAGWRAYLGEEEATSVSDGID